MDTSDKLSIHIGILLCDDYYPEFISDYGHYDDAFKKILAPLTKANFHTWRCHLGEFPAQATECDVWIVSGSKWSAYEDIPWITRLLTLLQEIDRQGNKLIGICFGHQIIHQALGGKVGKSPLGWGLGFYPIQLQDDYKNLQQHTNIRVLAMHQDQVLNLAPGFETLAGSDFCPNAMTRKQKHILTLQPHPEFSPEFFTRLCEYVRDSAGDEKVAIAQKQTQDEGDGDRHLLNELIQEFILG